MDKYTETFETWNKIASVYEDKFMNLNLYDETYLFFCNLIQKNKAKILEIGCGPGNITKYLLSQRPDFDLLGIDVAPNMVALAQKNNPSARFSVMDCRHLDSIEDTFDGIVSGFCLPFLSTQDVEKFFADAARLLVSEGVIYLSFVAGDPAKSEFKIGSTGDRCYFHYHDFEQLKGTLLKHEFEVTKVFEVEYAGKEIHTIITATKK